MAQNDVSLTLWRMMETVVDSDSAPNDSGRLSTAGPSVLRNNEKFAEGSEVLPFVDDPGEAVVVVGVQYPLQPFLGNIYRADGCRPTFGQLMV